MLWRGDRIISWNVEQVKKYPTFKISYGRLRFNLAWLDFIASEKSSHFCLLFLLLRCRNCEVLSSGWRNCDLLEYFFFVRTCALLAIKETPPRRNRENGACHNFELRFQCQCRKLEWWKKLCQYWFISWIPRGRIEWIDRSGPIDKRKEDLDIWHTRIWRFELERREWSLLHSPRIKCKMCTFLSMQIKRRKN